MLQRRSNSSSSDVVLKKNRHCSHHHTSSALIPNNNNPHPKLLLPVTTSDVTAPPSSCSSCSCSRNNNFSNNKPSWYCGRYSYREDDQRKLVHCLFLFVFGVLTLMGVVFLRSTSNNTTTRAGIPHSVLEISHNIPHYDAIVVGMGPAGLTASIFAKRNSWRILVLGSLDQSQLAEASHFDNLPGYYEQANKGLEWLETTQQQAIALGVEFLRNKHVQRIVQEPDSMLFLLELPPPNPGANNNNAKDPISVYSRAVIIATGSTPRRLHLSNEDMLWGQFVHSCAICDGSAYHGADTVVVVVGGGRAALDAAVLLSRHAKHVVVVHRRLEFRGNIHILDNIDNVRIQTPFTVQEYEMDTSGKKLVAVHLVDTSKKNQQVTERLECNGVFVLIGSTPNTDFLKGLLPLDMEGRVVIPTGPEATATSVPGVFAAGDVADGRYQQAITAAATGAQAALDMESWLQQFPPSSNFPDLVTVSKTVALPNSRSTTNKNINHPVVGAEQQQQQPPSVARRQEEEQKQHPPPNEAHIQKDEEQQQHSPTNEAHNPENEEKVQQQQQPPPPPPDEVHNQKAEQQPPPPNEAHNQEEDQQQQQQQQQQQPPLEEAPNQDQQPPNEAQPPEDAEQVNAPPKAVDCDLRELSCIQQSIRQYPVVMFSKAWCPYCKRGLAAFEQEGLPANHPAFKVIDLDVDVSGDAKGIVVEAVASISNGRRLVPNIFINGRSYGGNIMAMKESGRLRELMQPIVACTPMDLTRQECVTALVQKFPVVVFSKPWCPYCRKALAALHEEGVSDPHVVDLMQWENFRSIQDTMLRMTGRRTVPNVFVHGTSIGGGDETMALHNSGELRPLLEQAGAIAVAAVQVQR